MSSLAEVETQTPAPTGHPKGLYVLFGAEMWERFSYYGMRALLVLYLVNQLKMPRADALALYGVYTGLVYVTPLLGGYLADKFLGQRKAILIGGIVMAMGHFAMAFPAWLEVALGLLILGNGFFKPNISTMVGKLYPQGDDRRDRAYTIFYMGINTGAFFSPLVCGWLAENPHLGWHYGFAAAGVGMVFGLISFLAFQNHLVGGYPPGREEAGRARLNVADWVHITLYALACLAFSIGAIRLWPSLRPYWSPPALADRLAPYLGKSGLVLYHTLVVALAIGLFALVMRLARPRSATTSVPPLLEDTGTGPVKADQIDAPFTPVEWQRIGVILIVAVFSIVFFMGFEQSGGTLNLFASERTDRSVPTWLASFTGNPFPASWFQSVNPLLIVLLAPFMILLWAGLDRTRFKVSSPAKMAIGILVLGAGFAVMSAASKAAATQGKVGPGWLSAVYFLFTVAELCLSPIGLSLVNKLAPARVASLLMATWFLCTAIANYLAAILESMVEGNYDLWKFLMVTSFVPGLILLALTPVLRKMGHGRI